MLDDRESDDDSIDEHGWRISKEMMDRLDNSSWLRKELADGGLRQIIATIDTAPLEKADVKRKRKKFQIGQIQELTPREAALERAKYTNPKFAKFLNKLMLTAGVLVDHGNSDTNIAAFLSNNVDSSNLALVSLPSKRQLKLEKKDDNIASDSSSSSDNESDIESETEDSSK